MTPTLNEISNELKNRISKINNFDELELLQEEFLGKDSILSKTLKNLKVLPEDERRILGKEANIKKLEFDKLFADKKDQLIIEESKNDLIDFIDISYTQTNQNNTVGNLNPLTSARFELEDIFAKHGFEIHYPLEVDTYENNFEYVNMPKGHPATDSWDTFFTRDQHIPIVHTSSMQNRILKRFAKKLDVKNVYDFEGAIVPGRCFRRESTDARHEHTFHQLEGVAVGKSLKYTDMIGVIKLTFEEFFKKQIHIRIIPDYFPFVEPGNGIEIRWDNPSEKILKITKGTGWLEVMGCGMIHPEVLKMAEIDPDVFSGFAWGCGIERLLMIRDEIEDIRYFINGGQKFIRSIKN